MTNDPIDRFIPIDPNGNPHWKPLWGKDGSLNYGKTIPTPQAAIRAFFGPAKTLKGLVDSAPRTQDGVHLQAIRAVQAELSKLALLGSLAVQSFYSLEKTESPADGIQTSVHSPHFAHEGTIAIINQMAMLPLGTLDSSHTLSSEQVDLFDRRFTALENLVDRLIPEEQAAIQSKRKSKRTDGDKAKDEARIMAYLMENPTAKRDEVAKATGIPAATVSASPSWKQHRIAKTQAARANNAKGVGGVGDPLI